MAFCERAYIHTKSDSLRLVCSLSLCQHHTVTKHSKLINFLTSGNAPVALLSSLSSKLTLSALGPLFFYIDLFLASVLSLV